MVKGFKVTVSGLRELEESMAILTKATGRNVLKRALAKGGAPIAAAAVRNAPREFGDLEGSVRVSTRRPHDAAPAKKAFAAAMRATGDRKVAGQAARAANASAINDFAEAWTGPGRQPQAIQTEFGNEHQAADPWLRPAWDAEKQKALDEVVKNIRIEVEKAVRRAQRKAAKQK